MFEIQRSGDKASSGEIGLDIRTYASPKVGQDQVSGGVSVPCRHATPVADAPWKPLISNVKFSKKSNQGKGHELVVSCMFECQWSQQKNICKSKIGQDQVSGGVSVLCWHAAPVAYVLWKPCTIR